MKHDIEVRQGRSQFGVLADGRIRQPGVTTLILLASTMDPEKTVAFTTSIVVDGETDRGGQPGRHPVGTA